MVFGADDLFWGIAFAAHSFVLLQGSECAKSLNKPGPLFWGHSISSTLLVIFLHTFTGKVFCFGYVSRGHFFRNYISVFSRILVSL